MNGDIKVFDYGSYDGLWDYDKDSGGVISCHRVRKACLIYPPFWLLEWLDVSR